MKNIIEAKKRRFYFQFLSILTILLVSILLSIARSNKLSIMLSINEEILPYLRRISHVGALSEEAEKKTSSFILKLLLLQLKKILRVGIARNHYSFPFFSSWINLNIFSMNGLPEVSLLIVIF